MNENTNNETPMAPPPSIYSPDPLSGFINVVWEGKPVVIRANDKRWPRAVSLYESGDFEGFVALADDVYQVKVAAQKWDDLELTEDGVILWQGYEIHNLVTERILQFIERGIDIDPVVRFLAKLLKNPSKRAVDELYTFLEHKNLPLTSSGNFIAYKGVRPDYMDCHSGTFENVVGAVLEMPRHRVDDDKNRGCSYGFHAGTLEYAGGFMPRDGHLMVVEIDPADVVSIPTDCSYQKLRTCRYKVVEEFEGALELPCYLSRFSTENDEDWDDEDEDWDRMDEDSCECCARDADDCSCETCEECGECVGCGECECENSED